MKNQILFIIIIFLVIGCSSSKEKVLEGREEINTKIKDTKEEITSNDPIYIDENPVIVGLYQNGKLVNSINTSIIDSTDIASFDVYFTNEEDVGRNNTKSNYNKYASNYDDIDKYKIGFAVSFSIGEDVINKTIRGPKDMYVLSPYIYNYLYDDIHQVDGSWYSHVEEKDVSDNTVYSSIKLYAAENTSKITSPITLMVFTYDSEDDFDEMGMYRGNSKYTVTINNHV